MGRAPQRVLEYVRPTPPAWEGGRWSAGFGGAVAFLGVAACGVGWRVPGVSVVPVVYALALLFLPLLLGAVVSCAIGLRNEPYVRRARVGILLTAAGVVAALAAAPRIVALL